MTVVRTHTHWDLQVRPIVDEKDRVREMRS